MLQDGPFAFLVRLPDFDFWTVWMDEEVDGKFSLFGSCLHRINRLVDISSRPTIFTWPPVTTRFLVHIQSSVYQLAVMLNHFCVAVQKASMTSASLKREPLILSTAHHLISKLPQFSIFRWIVLNNLIMLILVPRAFFTR